MTNRELVENVPGTKLRGQTRKLKEMFDETDMNASALARSMEVYKLGPIDMKVPEQVEERSMEYLKICEKYDKRPTVAGYAFALGTDRRTLWRYLNGGIYLPAESVAIVRKVYDFLNATMEDYMYEGKINPVCGIFLMKNNFGYKDQSEVAITAQNLMGDGQNAEELEKKYLDDMVSSGTIVDADE